MKIDKVRALITGGASGIGRAMVRELAKCGASVAFCDVNAEAVAAAEADAAGLGGVVKGFVADVSSEADVVALIPAVADALGGLDVLVNNAGIFRDGLLVKQDKATGTIQKLSLSNWQKVIDVDLTGPFLCAREFAAHCVATSTRPAVIVNISSIARHGNRGQSNYSAAKAGLIADTKLWAEELSRYGIRAAAVAPGFVRTPILEGMRPEVLAAMLEKVPLGRPAEPEELWQAVRFAIECDYFTGRCIDVDGGLQV